MENVEVQHFPNLAEEGSLEKPAASPSPQPIHSAAVATAFPAATEIAADVLCAGGNAADAAAAAAWALCACEPSGSGLGGQTTALILTRDGQARVLDGHSRAPARASLRTISAAGQRTGRTATTIPSTPMVLQALSEGFGTLSTSAAIEPAAALADRGHEFTRLQRREVKWCWNVLRASGAKDIFLGRNGRLLKSGKALRQPRLSATLQRLIQHGVGDFYNGALSREIVADMSDHGGLIDTADLAAVAAPPVRDPVETRFAGHRILSTPPTSGGVTLLQALKLSEALAAELRPSGAAGWEVDVVLDAVYAAFAFRKRWPLAPEEFTSSVQNWMLGDALTDDLARELSAQKRRRAIERGDEAAGETTHLCVADADGNVVALTQSIQSLFGAKVAHPSLGFFYNNYLTTCVRHRHPNRLAGGCTPRSNVCPTIALDGNGHPKLAIGAAGSRRIVSATLQVIRRVLCNGEDLSAALSAPRAHALLNGRAWIEGPDLTEALQARLGGRYRQVIARRPHDYKMGCVQAISWDDEGRACAAADPRRDGLGTAFEMSTVDA